MSDSNYCSNENCFNYSEPNSDICKNCKTNLVLNHLQHYLKSFNTRVLVNKKKYLVEKIQLKSLDYCCNNECSGYAAPNREYCKVCLLENLKVSINHYFKGFISRVNFKKYTFKLNRLLGFIKGRAVRSFLTPLKILNTIMITPDETIIKHITVAGDNKKFPKKGQVVVLHYTGKLLDGTKFSSSYDNRKKHEYVLGDKSVIDLWNIVIPTMCLGEKAVVKGDSEFCYKNKQVGIIPPDSGLYFEFELLDFHDKIKPVINMYSSEKLYFIKKYKDEAKIYYEKEEFYESTEEYKRALTFTEHSLDNTKILEEKSDILTNLSIIYGKMCHWINSLEYCKLAYDTNNKDFNTLYRLALSYYKTNNFDNAINISKKILVLNPNSYSVELLLQDSINKKNDILSTEKNNYNKIF